MPEIIRNEQQKGSAAPYDEVEFSGRPIAHVLRHDREKLTMVRHLGVEGCGPRSWSRSVKHDQATMIMDLAGLGSFFSEIGGQRLNASLRYSHWTFIPPGVPITIEFPSDHQAYFMTLPKSRLDEFQRLSGSGAFEYSRSDRSERLPQMLALLDRELNRPGFASDVLVDGLLRAMLGIFSRREDVIIDERVYISRQRLRRVADFVEAKLDQPITLLELADIAGQSVFHFSRMFKMATGLTPYRYVCLRRFSLAERLLRETDIDLPQIAPLCGFSNHAHFTAAFTKEVGISPGRYRRKWRS